MENNNNPMNFILSMMVESSLETGKELHELISKYKANGIDVVPISELEAIQIKGIEKSLKEDSLTQTLMKGKN